jgi:hypothetical protein
MHDLRVGTSPLEVMRHRLEAQRTAGIAFDAAWKLAIEGMPGLWARTLQETREAWQAGYERRGAHALVDAQELRQAAAESDGPTIRARMTLVA